MEIVLLQGAQADLLEAYSRFGGGLYEAADAALEQIRQFPESAPVFHRNYRRKVIYRYPFGIFYDTHGKRLFVKAVLDLRQDPSTILKRLG